MLFLQENVVKCLDKMVTTPYLCIAFQKQGRHECKFKPDQHRDSKRSIYNGIRKWL